MDELLKTLAAMLPRLNQKQLKGIVTMLGLENAEIVTDGSEASDPSKKAVTIAEIAGSLVNLGYPVQLPGLDTQKSLGNTVRPPLTTRRVDPTAEEEDEEDEEETPQGRNHRAVKAVSAAYMLKYGEKDPAMKAIMTDILGPSYQDTLYSQEVAFAKYCRMGLEGIDRNEGRLLHTQIFPMKHIMDFVIDGGLDVRTIKATQVEAQGELGGIAVPPQRQTQIETRLPGMTAVRGGGANVITLAQGSQVEIPQWRTDDTTDQRYIGMIRGARGPETAAPGEKNFKMDLVPLVAYLYTFKVPMSQSLVEDAANLVTMLMNDITITLAMDEDQEFLIGDGVGKSEGILPNSLNANSLKEVKSGAAAALTAAGIKKLKRGVASQYRRNCVWVANSDSWAAVEEFTAGAGNSNWAFPDLSEEDTLLGRTTYESEVMPDIGAGKFPIIFGWMQGYDIVERLGLTIQRFQDSGTGINLVEYHVRKRFGGKVEKPWYFAVQKVSA